MTLHDLVQAITGNVHVQPFPYNKMMAFHFWVHRKRQDRPIVFSPKFSRTNTPVGGGY